MLWEGPDLEVVAVSNLYVEKGMGHAHALVAYR
jgi:hypothetical protein